MKRQQTWTNGAKTELDQSRAYQLLTIARNEFELDAQTDLFKDGELRSATYAIIEALPKKYRKKIPNGSFVDIASIILLQKASTGYQIGLQAGLDKAYQAPAPQTAKEAWILDHPEEA